MGEPHRPDIYAIPAHRAFADALVAGLVPRYEEPGFGLARLTLILPSMRARRVMMEAFVRHAGVRGTHGLLMPRMIAIGDLDLDEKLGPLLDPLGAAAIPAAIDPMQRLLALAGIIGEVLGPDAPRGAPLFRLARETARTMDRLLVEELGPEQLMGDQVLDLLGDLAVHWQRSLKLFSEVQRRWLARLREHGHIDAAQRRNLLFDNTRIRWREQPPATPIVVAGVTSAAPALARLLRTISELPQGAVVLPDFDLTMDAQVWDELGRAGHTDSPGDPPFGKSDAITHPQYHLKLLLNRMGIAREEVRSWHRRGQSAAAPARSHAIASLFLPPTASRHWVDLPASKRRLAGVRLMCSPNIEGEAQAVAVLVRGALETPEKRIAIVTPDQSLAQRIVHHLRRWDVDIDNTAGEPLSQTAAGRAFLLLAETIASQAAPVSLLALLGHPLINAGMARGDWLSHTRKLELRLRGPRPAPGLEPLGQLVQRYAEQSKDDAFRQWWQNVRDILGPLLRADANETVSMARAVSMFSDAIQTLSAGAIWTREDGRQLAGFIEAIVQHSEHEGTLVEARDLAAILRDAMEQIAVRLPYGGHPRVTLYGLLEARMTGADMIICAGLNEGTWPRGVSSDGVLAPAILRVLGIPGLEFSIGLAAHDLAGALGAPEVVLSRAARDAAGPTIPSRFIQRVEALLGELAPDYCETGAPDLAKRLDAPTKAIGAYPRPEPQPTLAQRDVPIAVTALDRLRGDPYQFYAGSILRLRALDPLDADPGPAWQGELAHRILERWHQQNASGSVLSIEHVADEVLQAMQAHPLTQALWRPRLLAGLKSVVDRMTNDDQRAAIAWEANGAMTIDGVRIHGRADRIDRLADQALALIDYKTGKPPSNAMVAQGFALQLGLLGMIAVRGGFADVTGTPEIFEYWSLGKGREGFGYIAGPVTRKDRDKGHDPAEFLNATEQFLRKAIEDWIKGDRPFTARLNPDYPAYNDYDQLMRLDEWQAQGTPPGHERVR